MLEDVVRPRGPYRLGLSTYGRDPFETPMPGGRHGSAWQGADGLMRLRAPDEESLVLLRFVLALDADTTAVRRAIPARPAARPLDPRSARTAAAAAPDRRARAPAGGLRPADRGKASAGDRASDPARVRRPGSRPACPRRPLARRAAPARARVAARGDARPGLPLARPGGTACPAGRGGRDTAPARARARAVVARA